MNPQRSFLALGLLLALGALAAAQEPLPFVWSEHDVYDESGNLVLPGGGMVDLETGLVWSMNVGTAAGAGSMTYDWAMANAADFYAACYWGFSYTDWRIPSLDELSYAANRGLLWAYERDFPEGTTAPLPYGGHPYMTITGSGKTGYAVYLDTGTWIQFDRRRWCIPVILCRGAPPSGSTKPPKPPKPPKK